MDRSLDYARDDSVIYRSLDYARDDSVIYRFLDYARDDSFVCVTTFHYSLFTIHCIYES